jgi:hypothetical protein|tara:strand:- start:96 stop:506 length:411 start_codon:yes stop_codon:yes gene_type:complete
LINNRERMKQILDFNNLKINNHTPTDIDFIYEKNNKFWIIGEVKTQGSQQQVGQEILTNRLLDNLLFCKIPALFIITHHDIHPKEDVDVGNLKISIAEIVCEKNNLWSKNRYLGDHPYFKTKNINQICNDFALKYG